MVGRGKAQEEPALSGAEGAEAMLSQRGCCCFWVPQFSTEDPSTPANGAAAAGLWERIGGGGAAAAAPRSAPWWRRALLKVREWSEVVAGPRWKTLIRRFNRAHRRQGKFQYDPLSYALNFDEEDRACSNFSSRFVMPPSHGRTPSANLGAPSSG